MNRSRPSATVFDPRLRDVAPELRDAHGDPLLLYRGTQRRAIGGVRGTLSFTSSLGIAAIWSAMPGDNMRFTAESSVHVAHLAIDLPLVYAHRNHIDLSVILVDLGFGNRNGITVEEVRRIFNYFINRLSGKAQGGPFAFRVTDDDEDVWGADGDDVDKRRTLISCRDEFARHPTISNAERIAADTFVFADAPVVQEVARRLGFDGIVYEDVISTRPFRRLLGRDARNVEGVEFNTDITDTMVPTHLTYRPLDASQVITVGRVDTAVALSEMR